MEWFQWLSDQLLRMEWLYQLVTQLVENVFQLDSASPVGASIHFFIYDTIKLFILLTVVIFFISYIQSYFPPERTKRILGGMSGFKGTIAGAFLGVLTPFCSCSSIPIFIGFTSAGLPFGVTFSFLIASPMVDLASFLMLSSYFGMELAILYLIFGVLLAIASGFILEALPLSDQVESFAMKAPLQAQDDAQLRFKDRIHFSIEQVKEIVSKVWLYVLIGVGIGAIIHNWIPQSSIEAVIGESNPFAVVIATIIGVPIYADIFGTLPIADALFAKGVEAGTIVAFMMSVVALSLPSLIMLSKVIKRKLLFSFITIIVVGILLIGYLFNMIHTLF
ncbi:permease [Amphibacillus cookii]|uniref:permease n=1 Tax=Amphibacillus cookii TaxID=767787 RepID=UPI00195F2306|nr:uncharacterized membrane protein YraQ (UPF0718 family) [Amphibacillus cookii]